MEDFYLFVVYSSKFKFKVNGTYLNALYKLKKNVSKPSEPPSPETRPKAPPMAATV